MSGWSQLHANQVTDPSGRTSTGNLTWTATSTPGKQFQLSLETLLGPYTAVGTSPDGPIADFFQTGIYVWPIITYQGSFSGPTGTANQIDIALTADTLIDTTGFANPIEFGDFFLHLDQTNQSIDLVYFGVIPEPNTLSLTAVALLGVWRYRRRPLNRGQRAHTLQSSFRTPSTRRPRCARPSRSQRGWLSACFGRPVQRRRNFNPTSHHSRMRRPRRRPFVPRSRSCRPALWRRASAPIRTEMAATADGTGSHPA